ncbi:MAG TPA: WYL domain-containing protein [Myxococcota bacterium]|nr:WYL domain-containing protein [Myxococcota bacterium]
MRAHRLISLLLLLQNRGHGTAAELADELGVSLRTVYRDLEALGAAGIPIATERGPGGGCRLLHGYRTQLTGLDSGEAEALFLAGLPGPATELGLGSLLARAQRKVLAALPARLRAAASLADQRFHFDAHGWFQPVAEHPALETLAAAVWSDRRVRFDYERGDGTRVTREADALALGLKAGLWYLVGRIDGDPRVYRVSRISKVATRDVEFARDASFDLRAFWAEWVTRFETGLAAIEVTVRVARFAVGWIEKLGDPVRRAPSVPPPALDADGWQRRVLVFEKLEYAERALLGLGAAVEVVAPDELRARIAARAGEVTALYATGAAAR